MRPPMKNAPPDERNPGKPPTRPRSYQKEHPFIPKTRRALFFASDGQNVQFIEDSMILPDGVYRREELSIEKIQRLMESNPEDIRLHDSSLNNLVDILERTDRADEARDVKKLIEDTR